MKDHKFITAHFNNNEKTTVTVLWESSTGEIVESVAESKEGDHQWEELLTHVTINTLQENTFAFIKQSRKDFEDLVMRIAHDDGMIAHLNKTDEVQLLIDTITSSTVDKELLFGIKLALFEIPHVKSSENRANKTALRKAENILQAITAYSKFL